MRRWFGLAALAVSGLGIAGCGSDPGGEPVPGDAPAGFDCTGAGLRTVFGGLTLVRLRCGFVGRAAAPSEHGLVLSNVVAVEGAGATFVAHLPPAHPRLAVELWGADDAAASGLVADAGWVPEALANGTELYLLLTVGDPAATEVGGTVRWRTPPEGPCPTGCARAWTAPVVATAIEAASSAAVAIFDVAPGSALDDGRGGLIRVRAFDGRQPVAGATVELVPLFLAGPPRAVTLQTAAGPRPGDVRLDEPTLRNFGALTRVDDRLSYAAVEPWPALGLSVLDAEVTPNGASVRAPPGATVAQVGLRVTEPVLAASSAPAVTVDGAAIDWSAGAVEVVVPMATGAHRVVAVDDAGRTATQTVTVVSDVAATPVVSIGASPAGPVPAGAAVTLTAVVDPPGDYEYAWSGDGAPLGSGASIVVNPVVTTEYEVRLRSAVAGAELARASRTVQVGTGVVQIVTGVRGTDGAEVLVQPGGQACASESCAYSVPPGATLTLTARARSDASPLPAFERWEGTCAPSTQTSLTVVATDGLTCRAVFTPGTPCSPQPVVDVVENGQVRVPPVLILASSVRAGQVVLDATASVGDSNRTFSWRLFDVSRQSEVARSTLAQWTLPTDLARGRRYEAQLAFGCGVPLQQATTAVIFDIQ